MYCWNCGKENSLTSKFCFNCGSQIINTHIEPTFVKNSSMTPGQKKKIIMATISAIICLVVVVSVFSFIKSPEELLTENNWYSDIRVHCEYYDWTDKEGYYFNAECIKYNFYLDGETEITSYEIGNGGVCGPFSYEINSENVPSYVEWVEDVWENRRPNWEILDDKTLEYEGDHYTWDDDKETHCDCDNNVYDCKHSRTWYITKEYLRIGQMTLQSKKPKSL